MGQLSRRHFLGMAAATAAGITVGGCAGRAKASPAPAAATAQKRPPNILFFFPDQHRPDWIGSVLPQVHTPNLDRLAANGVRFRNTVCPSPLCAPSRSCMAQGVEYDKCGVYFNDGDLPLDRVTIYQLLRDGGYQTGGCGKFDLQKGTCDWKSDGRSLLKEWGFTSGCESEGKQAIKRVRKHGLEQGPYATYLMQRHLFDLYMDDFDQRLMDAAHANTSPSPLPEEAYTDNWVGAKGLAMLDAFDRNRPWFFQVNFPGPHDPDDPTQAMMDRVGPQRAYPPANENTQLSAEKHQKIRQNYTALVENIDRWIGLYIEKLRQRGELENTLIVYTSDHGEMLGDHNRWTKTVPYQASAGVPLIIAGPGVRPSVCAAPTTTVDLPATWLDYAGLAPAKNMDSRSLRGVLEGRTPALRQHVTSGLCNWRMVYDGRFKLITGYDPAHNVRETIATEPLLFDLQSDPLENRNIAKQAPEVVQRLMPLMPQRLITRNLAGPSAKA